MLEECNSLGNNAGGINIVFFATREMAQEYVDYFSSRNPFVDNEGKFNFYYIDDYVPQCEFYDGVVLYCYSKELIQKAASCPSDFIVVLEEHPVSIRSSAYINVMSLNMNHPLSVFLHEFGHVFANFAEEYVDPNARIPSGAKNCQANCEDFNSVSVCYEGCTKSDFFRTFFKGVMRTLEVNEYGPYDDNLIQERIDEEVDDSGLLTGEVIGEIINCEDERYYLVTEECDGQISIEIDNGCAGNSGYGSNEIRVLDKNQNEIITQEVSEGFLFSTLPGRELGGETYDNVCPRYYQIKIIPEAEEIQIVNSDGDVTGFVEVRNLGYRPSRID